MDSRNELQRKVHELETVIDKLNAIRDQLSAMVLNIQALPALQVYINKEIIPELTRHVRKLIKIHDTYERQLQSAEEAPQLNFTPQLKPRLSIKPNVPYMPPDELLKKYAPSYYNTTQEFNEEVRKNVNPVLYTSKRKRFYPP